MTNLEFSNEFDVLYNNITSNQAPGLDEYEKSVFLTKAQDEILKSYFNPRKNKTAEGFDGNERRQIDFSMVMRSLSFYPLYKKSRIDQSSSDFDPGNYEHFITKPEDKLEEFLEGFTAHAEDIPDGYIKVYSILDGSEHTSISDVYTCYTPFKDSFFDDRDNTKSISMQKDILVFINEYVKVSRNGKEVRLNIVPITYDEYNRVMSKPYKRPLKFQAWRMLDNSQESSNLAEIVIGPNDTLKKYVCRYVKRPRPIILPGATDGTELSLGGGITEKNAIDEEQGVTCELDPILHPEILQRAVELAKAAYSGDLNSQLALGQSSQTDIGMIAQSK